MKGGKRHIVVDVLGWVLGCYVSAANVPDVKAAPAGLIWVLELYERIAKVLADKGYRGALKALISHAFDLEERRTSLKKTHILNILSYEFDLW